MRVVEAISVWRQEVPTAKTSDFPSDPLGQAASKRPQGLAGASSVAVQQDGGGTKISLCEEEHRQDIPCAPEPGQSEAGGDATAQDLRSSKCSRDGSDQIKPPRGSLEVSMINNVANELHPPDMVVRGSRGPRNASEPGSGRVAKGRWVVTMMVPGRKLWGSSPAVLSQYKRFRRSSQQPKIARDQVINNSDVVSCTCLLYTSPSPRD